jgi:GNAT superfamily N-acetyltransferase
MSIQGASAPAARPFDVRVAVPAGAAGACACLRRSITELCVADHRNDAATLSAWLANKTVENVAQWIGMARRRAAVATRAQTVVGFGLLNLEHASIALLYVDPAARFGGVSDALLRWLEDAARGEGLTRLLLTSTLTAQRFYRARGYLPDGDPVAGLGVTTGQPMAKRLDA